jgi:hypothetical protein
MTDGTYSRPSSSKALVNSTPHIFIVVTDLGPFVADVGCNLAPKSKSSFPKATVLPWSGMAKMLGAQGIVIAGWPEGVAFPMETKRNDARSQGLKDLPAAAVRLLLAAFEDGSLYFSKGDEQGMCVFTCFNMYVSSFLTVLA